MKWSGVYMTSLCGYVEPQQPAHPPPPHPQPYQPAHPPPSAARSTYPWRQGHESGDEPIGGSFISPAAEPEGGAYVKAEMMSLEPEDVANDLAMTPLSEVGVEDVLASSLLEGGADTEGDDEPEEELAQPVDVDWQENVLTPEHSEDGDEPDEKLAQPVGYELNQDAMTPEPEEDVDLPSSLQGVAPDDRLEQPMQVKGEVKDDVEQEPPKFDLLQTLVLEHAAVSFQTSGIF